MQDHRSSAAMRQTPGPPGRNPDRSAPSAIRIRYDAQAQGHLLLEPFGVAVLPALHLREVVFISHGFAQGYVLGGYIVYTYIILLGGRHAVTS